MLSLWILYWLIQSQKAVIWESLLTKACHYTLKCHNPAFDSVFRSGERHWCCLLIIGMCLYCDSDPPAQNYRVQLRDFWLVLHWLPVRVGHSFTAGISRRLMDGAAQTSYKVDFVAPVIVPPGPVWVGLHFQWNVFDKHWMNFVSHKINFNCFWWWWHFSPKSHWAKIPSSCGGKILGVKLNFISDRNTALLPLCYPLQCLIRTYSRVSTVVLLVDFCRFYPPCSLSYKSWSFSCMPLGCSLFI